jgi:hypothetical protein
METCGNVAAQGMKAIGGHNDNDPKTQVIKTDSGTIQVDVRTN